MQPQVADDGGRYVHQDLLVAHLAGADVLTYDPADAVQPPTLPPVHERRLQLPNQNVLEVRQHAVGLEQSTVRLENLADLPAGEVVQRQPRDDVVVDAFARQLLHGRMDDADLVAVRDKVRVVEEVQVQPVHEPEVQLD